MAKDIYPTKKLILVLGMHRSGTSLISRSLKVFGAMHGENLLSSTFGNVKGHWEDQDFFFLNEEMLNLLAKGWDSPLPIINQDVDLLCQHGYMERATDLLQLRLASMPIFALKEPRMTKLLPFWLKVFASIPTQVHYVFAVRSPLNVAKSLFERRKIPLEQGLLLWYSYNAYAFKALVNSKVLFVDYDCFLSDTSVYLEKMSAFFNLPMQTIEEEKFLNDFLDKNLRNFKAEYNSVQLKEEKYYNKAYKDILKNMGKNYILPEFVNQFTQNTIFKTLELVMKNSK